MQRILKVHFDHPSGICTHPSGLPDTDAEWQTNASLIMASAERKAWVTQGPSCENGDHPIDAGPLFDGR